MKCGAQDDGDTAVLVRFRNCRAGGILTSAHTVPDEVEGVDATSIPEPPGYAELSPTEQVRYIQMLWDRLFERADELPVPESHLQLSEQRLDAYLRNPERARSAYDIIDELANQSK